MSAKAKLLPNQLLCSWCQLRNTISKVKHLEDDKYKNILEINNITNSIKCWNYIKKKYKNNKLGAAAPETSQYY